MILRPLLLLLLTSSLPAALPTTFPTKSWQKVVPTKVGLDEARLRQFASRVGGEGCVIRNGYMAYQWGDIARNRDWASAAKPVLGTMLLLAVQNQLLPNVHEPVAHFGWPLAGKDAEITFLQLANMTSGYACIEPPGVAWAYNDFGVQLLAKSLERVFQRPLDQAAKKYLMPLQFEDGVIFGSRHGLGVKLSPRDMARMGLLWLNEGRWNTHKPIYYKLFTKNVRAQVPSRFPRSAGDGHDYLGVGTFGGGTSQTPFGPGVYGLGFWFNEKLSSGVRVWPAATRDAFQANGAWNRDTVTIFPSLNMVVVLSMSKLGGTFSPGYEEGRANRNMKLLMDAVQTERPKRW